ncbi:MAG: type II secretion system F family protein [Gemmatimonadales bacterium]
MVGLPANVLVPALIAFLTVALATISLVFLWEWIQENHRKRGMMDHLRSLASEPLAGLGQSSSVFRSAVMQSPWLRPIISRVPQLRDAELLLRQADVSWSLQTLCILSVGMAVGLGSMMLIATGSVLAGFFATVTGAMLPSMYVRRRRTRRLNAFEEFLPESIDLVGRALRAGHPLSAGFKMAADDGPEPVAGEFRRIFEEQRFGLPLQDSLLGMADRINLVDVRILVTAILIQREVGGNLAEILDNLSAVVRARFTIRRQVRVYTAQGRMTGYLLSALPLIIFAILYALNGKYMSILFTDPVGKILVGVALSMQLIGFLWIRKIIKIEI